MCISFPFVIQMFILVIKWADRLTGGISGVDDAEDSGLAVLFSSLVRSVELVDVQRPAVVFIQVVIDLHGTQLGDCGWVKRVLRDGDHYPCAVTTFTRHQQLQNGLKDKNKLKNKYISYISVHY